MPQDLTAKVQLFWEGHKNVRNRPYGFEIYLVKVKTIRTIAHIFVAFSEKLNLKVNNQFVQHNTAWAKKRYTKMSSEDSLLFILIKASAVDTLHTARWDTIFSHIYLLER